MQTPALLCCDNNSYKIEFVWRQLEFAFFGAATPVAALFVFVPKEKEKKTMEEIEKNNVNCSNLQYDLSTESQPSKKEVVDFVETVLEMEIQAYTLLEMGNACVSKAKMFEKEVYKDEPRQKMWSAEKELREAKDNLKLLEVKKKDRIREAKGYFIANVAKAFVIGYIILLLALSLTLSIFDSFSDVFATNHEVSEDFLSAIIYILALMIGGFIVNIFKKKRTAQQNSFKLFAY